MYLKKYKKIIITSTPSNALLITTFKEDSVFFITLHRLTFCKKGSQDYEESPLTTVLRAPKNCKSAFFELTENLIGFEYTFNRVLYIDISSITGLCDLYVWAALKLKDARNTISGRFLNEFNRCPILTRCL